MDSRDDADETKVRSPYGDTGANINLVTPALAKKLGLPVKSYPQPIYVQFGQGETAKITHFIELHWIGQAAIADIPRSLISISAICAVGPLDVSFNARRIKIVDKGDPLKPTIYRKNISPNGLYEIDLEKFLKTKPPKHFEHYQEMRRLAGSKAKFLNSNVYQDIFSDSDSDNDQAPPTTASTTSAYAAANEDPLPPSLDACPFCNVCNIANMLDDSLPPTQEDDDILLQVPFAPANSRVLSKGTRISKELLDRVLWLHKCTGHQGREAMARAVRSGAWANIDSEVTESVLRKVFTHLPRTACQLAKRNRDAQQVGSGIGALHPGECLSIDYQGTISPVSSQGFNGFWLCEDQKTGYLHFKLTKTKSAQSLIDFVQEVVLPFYRELAWEVKEIRCDAGSSENSQDFVDFLQAQSPTKIKLSPSSVKEQQQNFVERANQTLTKGVGAVLLDQYTLSNKRWDLAVGFWIKTRNVTPNDKITNEDKSPLEMVTGRAPDFSKQFRFPFGCPVTVHDPDGRVTKFDVNNRYGIAVGDSDKGNGDILVIIPSLAGIHRPVEVNQVTPLRLLQKTLNEEQKRLLQPRTHKDGSLKFFTPIEEEASHLNIEPIPGSTLGFSSFGLPDKLPPSAPWSNGQVA